MHIMARGARMTAISPEAQALIDHLHAVDLAWPKLESEAVENVFNRHLEALGLPVRPISAMPDASSAYRRMIDLADATSWGLRYFWCSVSCCSKLVRLRSCFVRGTPRESVKGELVDWRGR
jgi:hypothetical protein